MEQILLARHGVDKTALGRSLAEHFEVPFTPAPEGRPVAPDVIRRFPPEFLRTHAVLPVGWKGDRVEVVVVNPHNLTLIDDIARQAGSEHLSLSVAVREDILEALDTFLAASGPAEPPPGSARAPAPATSETAESAEWEAVGVDETGYDLAGKANAQIDSKTIRLVNDTIQAAVDRGASDIHLETTRTGGLEIRFRVDGVCHDHLQIKEACARPVISRIKIMAQLNIAEHRLPQDGKIRLKDKKGRKTDLRVALMLSYGGNEDVVLWLLPEYQVLTLDQIAMDRPTLGGLKRVIEQPHGSALCVGPTG
jgi:type II secretory ATPase GspE/PulE/Tfp pilus assembly ATPase PilB-like protein